MSKPKVLIFVFIIAGLMCFSLAGYSYWGYKNLLDILAYYGVPKSVYDFPEIKITFYKLYLGMTLFSILGLISWGTSAYLILKNRKKTSVFSVSLW